MPFDSIARLLMFTVMCLPATTAHAGDCDIDDLQTPSWTIGGSPLDVSIVSETGEFPEPFRAVIRFSKPPEENPCGFHPPGTGHRWARLTLPSCYDFEIRIDYELYTWDHWDPTDIDSSDVFYAHIDTQPFAGDFANLSSVSCGFPGFQHFSLESTWWWGNDTVLCPAKTPCVNQGGFTVGRGSNSLGQHVIQVGLNTGFLYFSHGTFTVTIVPLHIELADPNANAASTPTTLISNGELVTDPQRWATEGTLRDGVAADASTRVVLRRRTTGPGNVDFSIENPFGQPIEFTGSLSTLGGDEQTANLDDVPAVNVAGQWIAFAVYNAPADFNFGDHASDGDRPVEVVATSHPQGKLSFTTEARREFEIVRPPLVLLHGLWSNSATWSWGFLAPPHTTWKVVHLGDYRTTAASSYFTNREVAASEIGDAISLLRAQNYACTKVDFIGHSMGGLLGRLYVTEYQGVQYRRNENFMEGDIHKLITLCTPHKGSPLANLLLSPPNVLVPAVTAIDQKIGCVGCGAVADLRVNSDAYAGWLNQHSADVPSHAMIATGGSDIITLDELNIQSAAGRILVTALVASGAYDALLWTAIREHDLLVDDVSQVGNVATPPTVLGYQSPSDSAVHTSVTGDQSAALAAINLLNTPVTDGTTFAPSFSGKESAHVHATQVQGR